MARVYLDTSFFFGLLDDQDGRRDEAERILEYERRAESDIFTSVLTINEYTLNTYHHHLAEDDCEDKVKEIVHRIAEIANLYAINAEIARGAAWAMSLWVAHHRQHQGNPPEKRKLRWDALHLATANKIGVARVYGWDDKWNQLPLEEFKGIEKIIVPAMCPQPQLPTD